MFDFITIERPTQHCTGWSGIQCCGCREGTNSLYLKYDTIRCSAMQCNSTQFSTVQYSTYRTLHGKCVRLVFTHELVKYRKSNEWGQRTSTISDTNQRVRKCCTDTLPMVYIMFKKCSFFVASMLEINMLALGAVNMAYSGQPTFSNHSWFYSVIKLKCCKSISI